MYNTKNALAELAKCLSNDAEYLYGNNDKASEDVSKAQRIVAELAKVEDQRDGETNSDVLWRCNNCIAKWRAIAEESDVRDGK